MDEDEPSETKLLELNQVHNSADAHQQSCAPSNYNDDIDTAAASAIDGLHLNDIVSGNSTDNHSTVIKQSQLTNVSCHSTDVEDDFHDLPPLLDESELINTV